MFQSFVILLLRGQFAQQLSTGTDKSLLYGHEHPVPVDDCRHRSVNAVNDSGKGVMNPLGTEWRTSTIRSCYHMVRMGSSNICIRKARGSWCPIFQTIRRQILTRRRRLSHREEGQKLMSAFSWKMGEIYVDGYVWVMVARQQGNSKQGTLTRSLQRFWAAAMLREAGLIPQRSPVPRRHMLTLAASTGELLRGLVFLWVTSLPSNCVRNLRIMLLIKTNATHLFDEALHLLLHIL